MLDSPDDGVIYAPQIEEFAREISEVGRTTADPVARSTALRKGVELVEPDWIIVSAVEEFSTGLPDRDLASDGLEFGEPDTEALAETVEILAEVRTEPVVCLVPDPVTMVLERFGDEWIGLLESDEFTALDVLHEASQLLSDILRTFDGHCSGLVLDATRARDVVNDRLSLEDYLLEVGPVFNLAAHHNVAVGGKFPDTYFDDYESLAEEFDFVVFDPVTPSTLAALSETSDLIGCSFPDSFWQATSGEAFQETCREHLDSLSSRSLLLLQRIPADVEPEYVQILGDTVGDR